MDKFELQKLRDLPIEGVAERLGLHVVRHKALCPFHDDHHASLSFRVSKNTFRCFVCGASGGTIDLVMRYLNKPFLDACRWLMDGSGVTVNGSGVDKPHTSDLRHQTSFDASRYERYLEHPFLNDEARRFLFDERRLDPRVVRWCRLTSWRDKQGVPWLQTPYYDREGKLVGIQNRNLVYGSGLMVQGSGLSAHQSAAPRFRFPTGSQCGIYNLPAMRHLQPACAEHAAPGRRPLHHRGMLRLLGDALCRSQSHRHPICHPALTEGHRTIVNYQFSIVN